MATKKRKVIKKVSSAKITPVKQVSYFTNRPYFTIAVLAVLVCALAYTVEMVYNATIAETLTQQSILP